MEESIDGPISDGDTGSRQNGQQDGLRRRLLKAGVASLPVMISLQSGTAWALSSCASRLDRPNNGAINSTFGDNNPNTSQQQNRNFVESIAGVTQADITSALNAFGQVSGDYPDGVMGTEVQRAEIMHLLVTNGSCWASYCAGSINSMDGPVTIENDSSPSFCNGA